MFELVKLCDRSYYLNYPTQVGVYLLNDTDVVLIDSGNDEKAGKLILKRLNERGWRLRAIYNTHCHADHVGGNAYLQRETGCDIFVPDIDRAAVCHTFLNQMLLSGSYPVAELDHKLFLAQDSRAESLCESVLPTGFEIVPLKGHTMGMVGYKTPDGVFFAADSLVSQATLEKYFVTYLISPADYLQTLEKLETVDAAVLVPSHVPPMKRSEVAALAAKNRAAVERLADTILNFCTEPRTVDEIIDRIFTVGNMRFSVSQYHMVGSTVRSFVAYLQRTGRLLSACRGNFVVWQAV